VLIALIGVTSGFQCFALLLVYYLIHARQQVPNDATNDLIK